MYIPVIAVVCNKVYIILLQYKQLPDYLPEHDPHVEIDSDTVSIHTMSCTCSLVIHVLVCTHLTVIPLILPFVYLACQLGEDKHTQSIWCTYTHHTGYIQDYVIAIIIMSLLA